MIEVGKDEIRLLVRIIKLPGDIGVGKNIWAEVWNAYRAFC